MALHPIFEFLLDCFVRIWTILFESNTLFGVSFGIIILGVTVAGVLWNIILLALGISSFDFSSLGSPKDYYHKHKENVKKEKQARIDAEIDFRSKHHGKLVDYAGGDIRY